MARGFLNHIWYKLLTEEGVPIQGATVYLYEYIGGSIGDPLRTTDSVGVSASRPLTTDSNGVFEFYVKDHIRAQSEGGYGYPWDTQYVISWSKDDKSGVIMGDNLFGEFESVVTSSTNTSLNKAISDYIGWKLQTHVDFKCG